MMELANAKPLSPQTPWQSWLRSRWPDSITRPIIILLSGGWSCIPWPSFLDQACRSILQFQHQCFPFCFCFCVQLTIQTAGRHFRFLPVNPDTRKLQFVSTKRIRAATINHVSVSLMCGQRYKHQYVVYWCTHQKMFWVHIAAWRGGGEVLQHRYRIYCIET